MTFALARRQQTALLFLAATGYVAWFAGLDEPLEARDIDSARATTIAAPRVAPLPRVEAAIRRDPFIRPRLQNGTIAPTNRNGTSATTPPAGTTDDDAIVPDIATAGGPVLPAASLTVRATIAGSNAVAYVANGSEMDIVRVGDALGARKIVAVDALGVAFADGSRLDLPDAYRAPRFAPREPSFRLGLSDLRRFFGANATPPASPAPSDKATTPAPGVAPSGIAYPTPGALRTIDARGLAPGANPTPDLEDPTPAAYPFPYAPPPRP